MLSDSCFVKFNPKLPVMLGGDLSLAIALTTIAHIYSWPNSGKVINGERWIWNTYEEWQKHWFPFWSVRKIQSVITDLEKAGFLASCQPDGHMSRKKYYRITAACEVLLTKEKYEDLPDHAKFACSEDANPALSHHAKFASSEDAEFARSLTLDNQEKFITSEAAPFGARMTDVQLEEIFQAYPAKRRGGRKGAYKAIKAAVKQIPPPKLLERVKAYAVSSEVKEKARKGEWNFVPLLETWLNKGRYDVEPEKPAGTPVTGLKFV